MWLPQRHTSSARSYFSPNIVAFCFFALGTKRWYLLHLINKENPTKLETWCENEEWRPHSGPPISLHSVGHDPRFHGDKIWLVKSNRRQKWKYWRFPLSVLILYSFRILHALQLRADVTLSWHLRLRRRKTAALQHFGLDWRIECPFQKHCCSRVRVPAHRMSYVYRSDGPLRQSGYFGLYNMNINEYSKHEETC